MSGDNNQDDRRSTSIPTPVLEYYKNYSLNKQLSKYFSGTSSVSYMPEIVQSNDDDDDDFQSVKDIEQPNPSPTSSITSNRKLEWDNGADIGYNNCNKARTVFKSSSLPILKSTEHKSDDCNPSSITTTTSSASLPIQILITDEQNTTTSNSNSQKSNILMDLKRKIGLPDAESTPKDIPIKTSKIQNRNIRLCLTKPILIDCCINIDDRKIDKDIQTSPLNNGNLTKFVQTGDSLNKHSEIITESNQSLIIINCNNSDKQSTNTDSIRTNSEIATTSNCNSFEYLSGDNYDRNTNNSNKTETNSNISELLQGNQSNYLITDIEHSIELLQRLLKSKRYDSTTKKRYIRKIIEKILNSKYVDDSQSNIESSNNGNHEKLETVQQQQQQLQDNIPWYPALTIKTFSNEYLPKSSDKKIDTKQRSIFTTNQQGSSSSSSHSHQNWKDNQTVSELLFENCKDHGDSLINYASKERQYQLQWINDEICHLGKLKQLLEKNPINNNNSQKTTTVYMMSENLNKNKKYRHNYIIETEIENSSSSSSCQNEQKSKINNIRVTTDDEIANIHVDTKKIRQPSLIGHGIYQTSTFPRSRQERNQFTVEIPLDEQKQILNERICNILKQFENICSNSGKSTTRTTNSSRSNNNNNNSKRRKCSCENKSIQVESCDCRGLSKQQQQQQQKSTQIDDIVVQNNGIHTDSNTECRCTSAVQTDDLISTKLTDSTVSSSTSQSLKSCNCCKSKFEKLYTSKKKLPTIPLCRPCYYQLLKHPQQSKFYNDPTYNCNCYTMVKTKTLKEIKKTVNELNDLEDYCTCRVNNNYYNDDDDDDDDNGSKYCCYCKGKLKKTVHNRNSIAYMLILENTTIPKMKKKRTNRRPLEEIKVKIPTIRPKKRIAPPPSSSSTTTTTTNKNNNLQDYLIKNRPKFVQLAELRRQHVINTQLQRELKQEENKLLFLENNRLKQQQHEQRLFSVKEMKENTKKHYQKLPEVQQKLLLQRDKQIRQANHLITDIFNRKLKENVLKGKLDFPSDLYVVNL